MTKRFIVLMLLWLLTFGGWAGELRPAHLTGIYSNLVQSKESGDLSGMELMIIPSYEGTDSDYSVFVQVADGGAPYAIILPMKVSGSEIGFDFPATSPYPNVHVVGVFAGKELVIRGSHGIEAHLKRGRSFWQ